MKKKKIPYVISSILIIIFASLFILAIKNENKLSVEISIEKGEKWVYNEKISIELLDIRDSKCPEGVQCFWSGEISADIKLYDIKHNLTSIIVLGTITRPSENISSYRIFISEKSTSEKVFLYIHEM